MSPLLWLVAVTFGMLAIAYAALGASMALRKKRHNAGFTCASVRSGGRVVHGCVCRDQPAGCAAASRKGGETADDASRGGEEDEALEP